MRRGTIPHRVISPITVFKTDKHASLARIRIGGRPGSRTLTAVKLDWLATSCDTVTPAYRGTRPRNRT